MIQSSGSSETEQKAIGSVDVLYNIKVCNKISDLSIRFSVPLFDFIKS